MTELLTLLTWIMINFDLPLYLLLIGLIITDGDIKQIN